MKSTRCCCTPMIAAGGLMTSEALALRRRMTATNAIQAIHNWQPASGNFYYLFVVDRYGHRISV